MSLPTKPLVALTVSSLFMFGSSLARAASSHPYDVVEQIAEVLSVIEDGYVEPPDRNKLGEGAIAGMVGALDPHSAYMPPEEYEDFRQDTSGRFAGIGVEVDLRNGQVVIIAPIAGSPAEIAGLMAGDRILTVDGVPLDTLPLTDIVHRMRGIKGTTVHLVVHRDGRSEPIRLNVMRDDVKLPSVYARTFDGQVIYIRITSFQEGTHAELLSKVASLSKLGPFRGMLLDLRQNPGGLVTESIAVADEFLPKGPLFFTRHRGNITEQVDTTNYGNLERLPVVTLVDSGTASAAEIVAGALKDRGRSTLVGNRTFGKGTVQSIIDLPGGAGLRLTTLRYYTPAGIGIQASGITPDHLVASEQEEVHELVRESDLVGHLPSDKPAHRATLAEQAVVPIAGQNQSCEVPKPLLTVSERIRQLPAAPGASSDKILAYSYRTLLHHLDHDR